MAKLYPECALILSAAAIVTRSPFLPPRPLVPSFRCVYLVRVCREILSFLSSSGCPLSVRLVQHFVHPGWSRPTLHPTSVPLLCPPILPPSLLLYPSAWSLLTIVRFSLPVRCLLYAYDLLFLWCYRLFVYGRLCVAPF